MTFLTYHVLDSLSINWPVGEWILGQTSAVFWEIQPGELGFFDWLNKVENCVWNIEISTWLINQIDMKHLTMMSIDSYIDIFVCLLIQIKFNFT